jgi:hypothetical protein
MGHRAAERRAKSLRRIGRVTEERPKFRFMDLEIWQEAVDIAGRLFDIAEKLETKRLYKFAEQLRGSGLSMSN